LLRVRGSYEVEEPLSWALALIALIFAFKGFDILNPAKLASPTLIGIVVGFIAHELAHRGVARMYGMSAHFVAFIPGLLVTFLSGFLPIVIIAPGYVRVVPLYGFWHGRGLLYSVAAGPLTNIIISIVSLVALNIIGYRYFFEPVAFVNAWIAFFNLLPIPPLDGSKIFASNTLIWLVLLISSIALLIILRL
jgi:Zn-dependent protease